MFRSIARLSLKGHWSCKNSNFFQAGPAFLNYSFPIPKGGNVKSILATLILVTGLNAASASVDLDQEMANHQFHTFSVRPPIDLTPGFPDIVAQAPLGACQSFAMAAWLDYIFYFKTGHVIDLSEKQIAYELLAYMVDEFWDPVTKSYPNTYKNKPGIAARPTLGSGIAPFMLASYFKTQAIPNGIYSFGNMTASEGAIHMDFEIFNDVFENEKMYTRDEYLKALPEAFLFAPPQRFVYKLAGTDFKSGKEETLVLKSAKEIGEILGLDASNVVTHYNAEHQGYPKPIFGPNSKEIAEYFQSISTDLGQKSLVATKKEIYDAIKKSLDRRMAVMVASSVWMGDWGDGVVFAGGGGHAMVIVGYQEKDGTTYFKLRNSWGKDRLVKGYNFVDSDTLLTNALYIVSHTP